MPRQLDLFADESPDEDQPQNTSATSLKLTPRTDRLSPEQQQFNKLLDRIDKLKNQLVTLDQLCDAHRPVYHRTMEPLREQQRTLLRDTALWLDKRLQRSGLTATQKQIAVAILCELSMQLALGGDEEMENLHNKHSDETLVQKNQYAVDDMRDMMEEMLGEALSDERPLETVDDILKAGMKRMREAKEAEEEARRARLRKKKPSAAKLKAQSEQADAESTLRKVFRQLASALHPDRESDPVERTRKTALMSEANAAYERRDLVALLQIQLRTELTDTASIAQMTKEKIAPLTLLLKQQIQELEEALYKRQFAARQEFGLDSYEPVNVRNLRRELSTEENVMQKSIVSIQQDLQKIDDDKFFKRWLKEQKRAIDDMFMEAMYSDLTGR